MVVLVRWESQTTITMMFNEFSGTSAHDFNKLDLRMISSNPSLEMSLRLRVFLKGGIMVVYTFLNDSSITLRSFRSTRGSDSLG